MSSTLREWFVFEAGLSEGARLESVLEQCREGELTTVEDLKELATMPEAFREQFPAAISRGKIKAALAKEYSKQGVLMHKTLVDAPGKQPAKIGSTEKLPEGKL